jgi:hypothetical protein
MESWCWALGDGWFEAAGKEVGLIRTIFRPVDVAIVKRELVEETLNGIRYWSSWFGDYFHGLLHREATRMRKWRCYPN